MNSLFYGDPGSGKTHLLGTAQDHPLTSPVLIIDCEAGVTTLRKRKDIDVKTIRSISELVGVHKELYDNPGYYKSVGLDSLTELQRLDMIECMLEAYDRNPNRNKDEPSQREWTISGHHIRRIVRGFRDLPCHTFITALAATERDSNNVQQIFPSIPGKLKTEVPGFLDIVGYLRAVNEGNEIVRKMQFANTERVIAKDRTGELEGLMENPTIPEMFELIHNGGKTSA